MGHWKKMSTGSAKKEDTNFSNAIRQRDNWTCRRPSCTRSRQAGDQIDCAHIQGRRHLATRWDARNAIALCRQCHNYFEDRPLEFTKLLLTIGYTQEDLDQLIRDSHKPTKAPAAIRQAISDHYRLEWRRMEREGSHDLRPYGEGHEDVTA